MQTKVLVSTIIPTYNSAPYLEKCLVSIKNQTYPHVEIIVVDNHSKDRTVQIAQQYGNVYIKGPERSSQRNYGASEASGAFVFFIDSDMELEPEVVEECVIEASKRNIDTIVIPEVSVGDGFWTRCKALERSCYIKDSLIEAARFYNKKAFFEVNGYDENLIAAEDWDLSLRIKKAGFSFSRINALIKHHEGRLSLKNTIKKKYSYGLTIHRYIKKHKEEAKKQFMPIRPSYLRNYKRLLQHPVLTMGFLIMKTFELGAFTWGMIVNKYFPNYIFKD